MAEKLANKWAIPALALGIGSIFLAFLFAPPILAIIFGAMGLSRAAVLKKEQAPRTGIVMSIVGLILGIVYLPLGFYAWVGPQ